jgi:hypothetical protein
MKLLSRLALNIYGLWVANEPKDKEIIAINLSKERNVLATAERVISEVVEKLWSLFCFNIYVCTWYMPQACKFLKLSNQSIPLMRKVLLKEVSTVDQR